MNLPLPSLCGCRQQLCHYFPLAGITGSATFSFSSAPAQLTTGCSRTNDREGVHSWFCRSSLTYACVESSNVSSNAWIFSHLTRKHGGGVQIVLLIYNRRTKCAPWQRLMGWSRKKKETAGCGKGDTGNDESGTAARRDRRFLELLRMWSRHGWHPERWVLFTTATGIPRSSPHGRNALRGGGTFWWNTKACASLPSPTSVNYTWLVKLPLMIIFLIADRDRYATILVEFIDSLKKTVLTINSSIFDQ